VGVPAGLMLAGRFGWHAAFFFLAACAALNLFVASLALPHLRTAVHGHEPWKQMRAILGHRVHLRAFAVGSMLGMAGGILVPFLAPSFIANVGLNEQTQLPVAYMVGGIATALSTPLVGWLSDHMDRLKLLAIMSVASITVTFFIMRLGPSSLATASLMMALFMVSMSSRYAPAMTMIANAVEARYRGGFMSIISALQLAANALASVIAGLFVTRQPSGHLAGLPTVGHVATGLFLLTLLFAIQLRNIAPHVATHHKEDAAPPPAPPDVG
jgi:predicted MFS family arabinose efflux permease